MKIRNLLFTIFIGLSILSCSSNDNKNYLNYSELIIGEWDYLTQTINGIPTDFGDECQLGNEYQVFMSNGTYKHIEFDNLIGNGCEQVDPILGNWEIKNTILTIMVPLPEQTYVGTAEILELTESRGKFLISQDSNYDGDDEWIIIMEKRN